MSEFDEHDGTPPADLPSSPEVDDADAYEQLRTLDDTDDDLTDVPDDVPDDVDPADAYEQHRVVGGDDDYDDR